MRVFNSPRYTVDMGDHVFPTAKFFLTARRLLREGVILPADLVDPGPPDREDLLLAHDADWVDKVLEGRLTPEDEERLELPFSPALAASHLISVQGTVLACREALATGLGLHIGGGAHHAMRGHGEGFCVLNDIAVGALKMLAEGRARRAAVIDLDVHQGNGTAEILKDRPEVFTFSMHQESGYPEVKSPGSLDIGLPERTGDAAYLKALEAALPEVLDGHRPELVVYQAGADPFFQDQLGALALTQEGLEARDIAVFRACLGRGVPVAVTLGGGYAARLEDTVAIHATTLKTGLECWKESREITGGSRRWS